MADLRTAPLSGLIIAASGSIPGQTHGQIWIYYHWMLLKPSDYDTNLIV